jgi:hypothetical protein
MEQDQPANHCAERLVVPERVGVGLHETDVLDASRRSALLCDGEHRRGLIDSDHRAGRSHELRELERDVAKAGAEIGRPAFRVRYRRFLGTRPWAPRCWRPARPNEPARILTPERVGLHVCHCCNPRCRYRPGMVLGHAN